MRGIADGAACLSSACWHHCAHVLDGQARRQDACLTEAGRCAMSPCEGRASRAWIEACICNTQVDDSVDVGQCWGRGRPA